MKRLIVSAIFFYLLFTAYSVNSGEVQQYRDWFIDSYQFGKSGNDCSDIYFNYGTDKWTFNAEDPELLRELHKACTVGKSDRSNNQNNLTSIINNLGIHKQ